MSVNLLQCWQVDGCSAQHVCVFMYVCLCICALCMIISMRVRKHRERHTSERVQCYMLMHEQMNLCIPAYPVCMHTFIVCVRVHVCVWVSSQAVHCGVIAASESAALDYRNLLPWECRALWENRKRVCLCARVCVCVCVWALWEKCACSVQGTIQPFLYSARPWSHIKLPDHKPVVSLSMKQPLRVCDNM